MSFFQQFSVDASNACNDLYKKIWYGDDSGKSIRTTLILKPQSLPVKKKSPVRIDLGMTFIEINGRAYVKSVASGSSAARAGECNVEFISWKREILWTRVILTFPSF
jgi:hypothetical protein